MNQYEITKEKLATSLMSIEVMARAIPSEKLSAKQIEMTTRKAKKLVQVYEAKLLEFEKAGALGTSKKSE